MYSNGCRSTGLELSIQQRFKWVQLRCDQEPMRGILHRHMLRRLANAHRGLVPMPDNSVYKVTCHLYFTSKEQCPSTKIIFSPTSIFMLLLLLRLSKSFDYIYRGANWQLLLEMAQQDSYIGAIWLNFIIMISCWAGHLFFKTICTTHFTSLRIGRKLLYVSSSRTFVNIHIVCITESGGEQERGGAWGMSNNSGKLCQWSPYNFNFVI